MGSDLSPRHNEEKVRIVDRFTKSVSSKNSEHRKLNSFTVSKYALIQVDTNSSDSSYLSSSIRLKFKFARALSRPLQQFYVQD